MISKISNLYFSLRISKLLKYSNNSFGSDTNKLLIKENNKNGIFYSLFRVSGTFQ